MQKSNPRSRVNTDFNYSSPNTIWTPSSVLILILLFALAFWVRIQFIYTFGGMSPSYQQWATQFHFGGIAERYLNGAETILNLSKWNHPAYMPGYSAFLAFLKIIWLPTFESMRFVQAGLDATGVFACYYVLRSLSLTNWVSLLLTLLYVINPPWAFGSTVLMAEALGTLLILWVLALIISAAKNNKPWIYASLGLLISIAGTLRSDLLLILLPALLLGRFLSTSFFKLKNIALLLLVFLIPLSINVAYRYYSFGTFKITAYGGAYALAAGLGHFENPYGYYISDARAGEELTKLGIEYHTQEFDDYWMKKYINAWKEHPQHVIKSILWRLAKMSVTQDVIEGYHPFNFFKYIFLLFSRLALFSVGFAALILIFRKNFVTLAIMLFPMAYAFMSLGIVYWEPRYVRFLSLTYLFAHGLSFSFIIFYLSKLSTRYAHIFRNSITIIAVLYFSVQLVKLHQFTHSPSVYDANIKPTSP